MALQRVYHISVTLLALALPRLLSFLSLCLKDHVRAKLQATLPVCVTSRPHGRRRELEVCLSSFALGPEIKTWNPPPCYQMLFSYSVGKSQPVGVKRDKF